MKGFRSFKNYMSKTVFDPETKSFQEHRVPLENFDETPRHIPKVPPALAFMVVGLRHPLKTARRKTQK